MSVRALSARPLRRASVLAGATAALALLAVPATADEADDGDGGEDLEIETTYVVEEGDYLVAIAEEHDLDSWIVLYAVNDEQIDHPDVILVGQELDIPAHPDQVDVDEVEVPADSSLPEPERDMASAAGTASAGGQSQSSSQSGSHQPSQSASDSVWDRLAQCESNGDWSTNSGNGFSGGLQFHPQTWAAHGGHEFAPSAAQASRAQEIAVAERVLADQGWSAWPACSSKLGLH